MNPREQRGVLIAALCKLSPKDGQWVVPSQTGADKRYSVNVQAGTCTCPDQQETGFKCKHLYAVEFTMKREQDAFGNVTETRTMTFTEQKVYTQKWSAYNRAQSIEKDRFQELLFDLCQTVEEPVHTKRGPKPHKRSDAIFAMVMKVFCSICSRRSASDLREAHERGYLSRNVPGTKTWDFLDNADLTPILRELIATSAMPLRAVETDFAIDSSGFGSNKFERWYDEKYGVTTKRSVWVKVHLACGVKTNIVTAVRILDKDSADHGQFSPLVKETAKRFRIGEVSADKAYTSLANFETVAEMGGTAYLPFKSSATGGKSGIYEKMFHYFNYKRDEYMAHYHKRSNVETTFSMIKRKFGDSVRSKTDTAMKNEVLCKVLAHNLSVLIHEECELGIRAEFGSDHASVLPMVC